MVGVALSVMPMKPTATVASPCVKRLMPVAGNKG